MSAGQRALALATLVFAVLAALAARPTRGEAPPRAGSFNHATTRFALTGAHKRVACESCHPPGGDSRKWAGVPRDCHGCHGDHKGHKGALGPDCAACHDTAAWKAQKHAAAAHHLALTGNHDLRCAACHAGGAHLTAAATCADCHRQAHAGTRAPCETCHAVADAFRAPHFQHDFNPERLPGKHQQAPCLGCHPAFRFKGTSFACESCHAKDAPHDDLGACRLCHSPSSWKRSLFKHDAAEVGFALTEKHAGVACAACHTAANVYRGAPTACEGCHSKTPHGSLGPCARCHTPAGFAIAGFSHEATRLPLDERHRGVACATCHARVPPGAFRPGPDACAICHADPHRGQFTSAPKPGPAPQAPQALQAPQAPPQTVAPDPSAPSRGPRPCADCHRTRAWVPSTIGTAEHAAFGFPLRGAHAEVRCADCHKGGAFVGTKTTCVACHVDRHGGVLGARCNDCHIERSWKEHEPFDHGARTGFALKGAHTKVECARCHGAGDSLLARLKKPIGCPSCHTPKHGAVYGADCEGCHPVTRFSDGRSFDHERTLFPLERRHRAIACAACHDPKSARPPDPDCRSCHGDPHAGRTLLDCGECHRADSWLVIRYDHDRAEFPLKGKHFFTPCRDCHTNDVWSGLRRECVSCHRGDRQRADMRHADHAALSWDCIDCHRPWDWGARP